MPEKSHMYEIVPVDPLSKLQKKNDSIEEDIKEIKSALRGTVGLSKLESNADAFIQRMLDLMASSQKMVEEVAETNQQVASKIQTAIDHMNRSNDELSEKLTQILNFFAQATDTMGGEGESSDDMVDAIKSLKITLDNLEQQGAHTNKVLSALERHLKTRGARRPLQRQMQMLPQGLPPPPVPQGPPQGPPPQGQPAPQQGAPELPPPPFPP
jgi:chromosome segregation ATPase